MCFFFAVVITCIVIIIIGIGLALGIVLTEGTCPFHTQCNTVLKMDHLGRVFILQHFKILSKQHKVSFFGLHSVQENLELLVK